MPQNQPSLSVLPNESTVTKQKTDDLVFMRREMIIPKDYHSFYSLLSLEKSCATEAMTAKEVRSAVECSKELIKRRWSVVRKGLTTTSGNATGCGNQKPTYRSLGGKRKRF